MIFVCASLRILTFICDCLSLCARKKSLSNSQSNRKRLIKSNDNVPLIEPSRENSYMICSSQSGNAQTYMHAPAFGHYRTTNEMLLKWNIYK